MIADLIMRTASEDCGLLTLTMRFIETTNQTSVEGAIDDRNPCNCMRLKTLDHVAAMTFSTNEHFSVM